jgi:hypothetical protein
MQADPDLGKFRWCRSLKSSGLDGGVAPVAYLLYAARGGCVMPANEPIRIAFIRSKIAPRAFLVDSNLDPHSLEELRIWAEHKRDFVIIDEATGEDVTRILLA